MSYEYPIRIGYSQCDVNRELTITSLIDIFQDSSTFHSEDLNVGIDFLSEKSLTWVINYWEIEIEKVPKVCDRVTVGTCPYDFKGYMGYRNFYLKDENGNYIVKANTLWTLINMEKMLPEKPPVEVVNAYEIAEKLDMTYSSRKVAIPEGDNVCIENCTPIKIEQHHLDSNHHVNNGQYVKIAMSAMGDIDRISAVRVDYRKQAVLGSVIYPVVYTCGDRIVTALLDEEGKPYSVTEIKR